MEQGMMDRVVMFRTFLHAFQPKTSESRYVPTSAKQNGAGA
jgi:hypothetical protein